MANKKTTTKKATTSKTAVKKAEVVEPVVEAKVETVKAEPVAEVKVETPVVEETPAKKTTAKKTPAKKTTTTKKTTAKKAVEPVVDFFVEFNGVQESYATIIENVKKSFLAENEGAEVTSIKVYVKPQENAAYCVVNETSEFRMDVYF